MYVNTTDADEDYFPDALNLDLTDSPDVSAPPGVYGLFVSDPGDAHGLSNYVFANIDEQQFDFHVADGTHLTALAKNTHRWERRTTNAELWTNREAQDSYTTS